MKSRRRSDEMQSELVPVSMSETEHVATITSGATTGETSALEGDVCISVSGDESPGLEAESELLSSNSDRILYQTNEHSSQIGVDENHIPDYGGDEDSCAKTDTCPENSEQADDFPGGDFAKQVSKHSEPGQTVTQILAELRSSAFSEVGPPQATSASLYDTDCTRTLLAEMKTVSASDDLLGEIESELLSGELAEEHHVPNGASKGQHALALFEKCVHGKYLQQELTIKK